MPIKVGSKAPDFSLKSKNAAGLTDVKLSDNIGKKNTLLLFFPAAFTSVCTEEMCDISAGLSQFSGLNAAVIAISVDTPFAQEAWAKQSKISLTLASDLNKTVTKAYDVLFPNLAGDRRHVGAGGLCHRQTGRGAIRGANAHAQGLAQFRRHQGHALQTEVNHATLVAGLHSHNGPRRGGGGRPVWSGLLASRRRFIETRKPASSR